MAEVFSKGACLLRIYTAEKDHINGVPLFEFLAQKAAEAGLSGVTVLRGIGGFCSTNPVITPDYLNIQINQPVIVEIIDRRKVLEKFVLKIDRIVPCGLMTLQELEFHFYGAEKKRTLSK